MWRAEADGLLAGFRHAVSRCFSSARLPPDLCPCVSAKHTPERPSPTPLRHVPYRGRDGWTMVAASGGWLPSSRAEKDILILEINGNSSVVEIHRPKSSYSYIIPVAA